MIRRAARIAGISYIPKNGSRLHDASGFYVTKPVQMSIVMPLPARTKDANDVAAQVVFANFEDYAVRGAEHGTTQRGKDVDSLVTPVSAAWSAPGIFQIP